MTVTGKSLPGESTILGAVDAEARSTVVRARDRIAPIVAAQTPRRSGTTANELRPRISRTSTGAALSVGATRNRRHPSGATIAQVVRWVNRGTGIHRQGGGAKVPITPSAQAVRMGRSPVMILPGGKRVASVRGQRPNAFMGRIHALATPAFERVAGDGAQRAALRVERVLS